MTFSNKSFDNLTLVIYNKFEIKSQFQKELLWNKLKAIILNKKTLLWIC